MEREIHFSKDVLRADRDTLPASSALVSVQEDVAGFVMIVGFHFDSLVPGKGQSQRGVLAW